MNLSILNSIMIVVIIIIIYVLYMNHKMSPHECVHYNDVEPHLKTGDMILFHALNNYYAPIIGSYYTHVGIIYRGPYTGNEPYILEAAAVDMMPFYGGNSAISNENGRGNGKGIMFTSFKERLHRYLGYIVYKPLEKPVSKEHQENFPEFVEFCMKKMYYNYTPFRHSLSKLFLNEPCGYSTNCGEIVFLALIRLGLLDVSRYSTPMMHYLRYVCAVTELDGGNCYKDPSNSCCIVYDPFWILSKPFLNFFETLFEFLRNPFWISSKPFSNTFEAHFEFLRNPFRVS